MRNALAASLLTLPLLMGGCSSDGSGVGAVTPQAPAPRRADACDWRSIVQAPDRAAVEAEAADALARIPSSATAPDYLGEDLKEASLKGIVLAHALLQRARTPLPLGDVTGAWQVRSVQASGEAVYDYPFFRARIVRTGCGFDFSKTSGSQRRSGRLLAMEDPRALAFLGTATVNDNPTGAYGPDHPPRGTASGSMGDAPVNSAGRLVRIGSGELLMILDLDARGFELYHLKR